MGSLVQDDCRRAYKLQSDCWGGKPKLLAGINVERCKVIAKS